MKAELNQKYSQKYQSNHRHTGSLQSFSQDKQNTQSNVNCGIKYRKEVLGEIANKYMSSEKNNYNDEKEKHHKKMKEIEAISSKNQHKQDLYEKVKNLKNVRGKDKIKNLLEQNKEQTQTYKKIREKVDEKEKKIVVDRFKKIELRKEACEAQFLDQFIGDIRESERNRRQKINKTMNDMNSQSREVLNFHEKLKKFGDRKSVNHDNLQNQVDKLMNVYLIEPMMIKEEQIGQEENSIKQDVVVDERRKLVKQIIKDKFSKAKQKLEKEVDSMVNV